MIGYRLLINVMCTIGSTLGTRCPEEQPTCEQQPSNETTNGGTAFVDSSDVEVIEDDISSANTDTASDTYDYQWPMISDNHFFCDTSGTNKCHEEKLKQCKWKACRMEPLDYNKIEMRRNNRRTKSGGDSSSTLKRLDNQSISKINYDRRIHILKYLMNFVISINNDCIVKCIKQYNALFKTVDNVYEQLIELSHVVTGNDLPAIRNDVRELLAELKASTKNLCSGIDSIIAKMRKINKEVCRNSMINCKRQQLSANVDRLVDRNMAQFASHIATIQESYNTWFVKTSISLEVMGNKPGMNTGNVKDDRPCVAGFKAALQQLHDCVKNVVEYNSTFILTLEKGSLFLDRIERCIP